MFSFQNASRPNRVRNNIPQHTRHSTKKISAEYINQLVMSSSQRLHEDTYLGPHVPTEIWSEKSVASISSSKMAFKSGRPAIKGNSIRSRWSLYIVVNETPENRPSSEIIVGEEEVEEGLGISAIIPWARGRVDSANRPMAERDLTGVGRYFGRS